MAGLLLRYTNKAECQIQSQHKLWRRIQNLYVRSKEEEIAPPVITLFCYRKNRRYHVMQQQEEGLHLRLFFVCGL